MTDYLLIPVAYLFGSISSAIIVCRLMGLPDPRTQGSGNPGATNVLRTGRKGLAALTLLLDGAKGWIAVLAAGFYGPDYMAIAAVAVVVGHIFPVWLRFRGGKGIATALGVLFALAWPVALAACLIWVIVAAVSRYSSLAALIALPASPFLLIGLLSLQRDGTLPYWLPGEPQFVEVLAVIVVLIVARHYQNLRRLLQGKEPRIGESSKTETPA
jgi:glycerol-3-phosphate acyltransferase PlsY